ncbi:hypothetical protein Gotri_003836 [Gossypium trilobum]|uniref:DUF4283 domain-containing protein n=1 Tax=Gossypium trilobum TaxID=34281 RepID=A0A7J9F3S9_9ROSI|nr:hypothetical protein [Gossypium trilobum]
METELANLSINEEEEEILLVQADPTMQREVADYQLVGCFLTASIINFPAMKSTLANLWHPVCGVQIRDLGEKRGEDLLKIPLVFVPFWVQIHDVPVGLFSENLAIQLGNFIGVFLEYDASNLGKENRNYMRIRVQIGVRKPLRRKKQARMMMGANIIKMGWDLSLRAPSRRALAMNSIWLREKGESKSEGSWIGNRTVGLSSRDGDLKGTKKKSIDSILGFSLEGEGPSVGQWKDKLGSFQGKVTMEYDVEDETLIGEEGKKRNRVEMEDTILLSSATAKRLADREQ